MSTPAPHIRWMIRRDMPEVLAIDCACFHYPWVQEEFVDWLRQRNVIGMVAERDERIVGYMIYLVFRLRLELVSFAVHPDHQRQGVGRAMFDRLRDKLSVRRPTILLDVRESNLAAHKFFAAMGCRAVGMSSERAVDGEEAYRFVYAEQHGRRPTDAAGEAAAPTPR